MKIKICGLKRVEEIRCLNRLRPDFCGFVFAPESRRYLEKPQALELKKILSPAIPAVGVFVNAKPEAAAAYVREGIIDAIQLHGQEDEAYLSCLRRFTDAPVIQAFSVNTEADLRLAEKSSADLVLLDSGAGGTGKRFDWNLLENFSRPFLLAGGLNAGKCPGGHEDLLALGAGHQQRRGNQWGQGPFENRNMHQEDQKCLKEDLERSEANIFRKLS